MKKKNAIIVMTALVPTLGHRYLIDFARNFVGPSGFVSVLVCGLKDEPIDIQTRVRAFMDEFEYCKNVVIVAGNMDGMPQLPEEDENFWDKWAKPLSAMKANEEEWDNYIIASETYGIKLAEVLNCDFVPCNIYREIYPIKGTYVRENIIHNFDKIMPAMKKELIQNFILFGAESTGKTTMARRLANKFHGYFVPEWAREYLETCGAELTEKKMENIFLAQYASELHVEVNAHKSPFIFRDTNVLSTIGYYRLLNMPIPEEFMDLAKTSYKKMTNDFYFVMNSGIPFEPDPLRYGGDKRESSDQFWIDILKEFKCNYCVVPNGSKEEQLKFCEDKILEVYNERIYKIQNYVRRS